MPSTSVMALCLPTSNRPMRIPRSLALTRASSRIIDRSPRIMLMGGARPRPILPTGDETPEQSGFPAAPKRLASAGQRPARRPAGQTIQCRMTAGSVMHDHDRDDCITLFTGWLRGCLLYTSDAADDLLCVDLGG